MNADSFSCLLPGRRQLRFKLEGRGRGREEGGRNHWAAGLCCPLFGKGTGEDMAEAEAEAEAVEDGS